MPTKITSSPSAPARLHHIHVLGQLLKYSAGDRSSRRLRHLHRHLRPCRDRRPGLARRPVHPSGAPCPNHQIPPQPDSPRLGGGPESSRAYPVLLKNTTAAKHGSTGLRLTDTRQSLRSSISQFIYEGNQLPSNHFRAFLEWLLPVFFFLTFPKPECFISFPESMTGSISWMMRPLPSLIPKP